MVARCQNRVSEADSGLDPDLLAEIAGLRARASSWEETAAAVQWDVAELRRVLRTDRAYAAVYEAARREVVAETEALALKTLRDQMSAPKTIVARAAVKIVIDQGTRTRADELKLRIARERIQARGAKGRDATDDDDELDPEPELTPEEAAREEEVYRRRQQEYAEDAARERAVVYLWGGCHRLGDAPPDGSDTPLTIIHDMTAYRGRPRSTGW